MDKQQKRFISNLRKAWRDEMVSAKNYRALAEQEKNPERKAILDRMAQAEDRHAERWLKRLQELGEKTSTFRRVSGRDAAAPYADEKFSGNCGADAGNGGSRSG